MKTTTKPPVQLPGKHFAAIKDVKQRRIAFTNYISTFYHTGNRCLRPSASPSSIQSCQYSATETSPGCAIGQFLSHEGARRLDTLGMGSIKNVLWGSRFGAEDVPQWMKDMGAPFLAMIQDLHDLKRYWTTKGLSRNGRMYVTRILKEIEQL